MKALLRKFRFSRKLGIVIGGAALLVGGSGALALYLGAGLGSAPSADGLQCTDVNLVTIRKQDHLWIRKYITTEPTDGLTRAKTALRIAKSIYDQQKPDLVQVVVLDKNGPSLRSDIRGRALGADVVYVPDPSKVGDGTVTAPITARYYDGGASDEGLFYGERVDMTPKDIDGVIAGLKDHNDCLDPVAAEAAKAGDKDKSKDKGKKKVESAEAKPEKKSDDDKHGEDTPPAQHPSPDHSDAKPDEKSTGFIGVSAAAPAATQPIHGVASQALDDAETARAGIDAQTTGAAERHSPITN